MEICAILVEHILVLYVSVKKNRKTMKTLAKMSLFVPFILLSIFLLCKVDVSDLEKYINSFISISLTLATFSISFSFLQYQFSPYKSLLKSVSRRQLNYSYLTIVLALLPLFILFLNKDFVPILSLLVIPILAYMLIFLLVVSAEESNPQYLLINKVKNRNLTRFLKEYEKEKKIQLDELKELEFSKVDETPMHDYRKSKYNNIIIKNNPFDFINEIVAISIINSDADKFESTIKTFLILVDKTISHELVKNSDFRFTIYKLISNSFERLVITISEQSANKTIQNRFLENIGTYLKQKALKCEQTNEVYLNMTGLLTIFAVKILEKGNRDGALFVVSLNRQLAQKGIYDPPKDSQDSFFKLELPFYPTQIMTIGQKAVELKNSDFLYRCLEELGYLGCTAIKYDHYQVGIECLQSLVQLGREARANNVKCFWRHCMLESIDHADERIWWMLSWVTHLEEKSRKQWIESFETAYSRLRGYKRKIEYVEKNGNYGFQFTDSKEPYTESFSKEQYMRKVDYSDIKETKEFKLY